MYVQGVPKIPVDYPLPVVRYPPEYRKPRPQREEERCCCLFSSVWCRSAMGCFLKKFDSFLNRLFYKLGSIVAQYTGYFIIVPLFITAILATGFRNINYIDDPEYLFAPSNGLARHERADIEKYFSINFTDTFHPSRVTRTGRFARFIIVAKDEGDLLRQEIWDEIVEVDQIVTNISVQYDERKYNYDDICAIWDGKCWSNSILGLTEVLGDINTGKLNLSYPIMINPITYEVFLFPFIFGGIEVSDDDIIQSVKALSISYWLRTNDDKDDEKAALWEEELLAIFSKKEFKHIEPARFTSRTLEKELENNTMSVVPYFGVTIAIMVFFSVVTVMMADWVRSKPYVGFLGIICAILSVIAAFGGLVYAGLPFIGINMAAPFLMLGIGIDDTFVMLAAWRRTNLQDSVPERLAKTYAEAAVSITITSITDMISFFIGVITPFPSVQIFCIYTGTAVFMTYLWHITLFGAILALAGHAEKNQKHSLFCFKVKSKSEAEVSEDCGYQLFCAGGINKADPYNPKDNKDHAVMIFFRDYVARFLNLPPIKALVIMLFLIYLAGGLYGCTKVREGLDRRRLSRYDSYSVSFYNLEDKYFRDFPYRVQVLITGDVQYHDPQTQEDLLELHDLFENQDFVAEPRYTESWMRGFFNYINKTKEYIEWNITDEVSFVSKLRTDYLGGSNDPNSLDVVFNEDYTRIIASRFVIQTYKIEDANQDKAMMEKLREIADNSKFNVSVYNPFFIFFDQYVLVRQTSIQAICLAAVVMMVVSVIFIPNPLCSLWVAFSMISIEIGVVGYMTLWNVNLDSISMINLIMCIGFSVDFSAHICYSYLAAKVDTPDERVRECLFGLGMPILQGGLSTILGILALILAPSYIFITFFKTVFLVIFFGAMHGILLLPVLLSLFGPGSCSKNKKKKKEIAPHPLYNENIVAPHIEMLEEGMRIPRPHSMSNSYNTTPKFSQSYLANDATNKDNKVNMEKDLGLGTSGEESSESSLSKEVSAENNSLENSPDHRGHNDRSLPILEVYSNYGYISDDLEAEERRNQERRSRFGDYDNMRMYRHSEYGGRQKPRARPHYSSTRPHSHRITEERPMPRHDPRDPRRGGRSRSTTTPRKL